MLTTESLSALLFLLVRWAVRIPGILAIALVGSYARGEARPDSDVDLVIITSLPDQFRVQTEWLQQIEWEHVQARVLSWRDADYGLVWSRHVQLSTGIELELSFAAPEWAALDPIDEGTQQVIQDGCWIVLDPTGLLHYLIQKCLF